MRSFIALLLVALVAPRARAMPQAALTTRSTWPEPIDTAAGFDTASRAEILLFTTAFADLDEADPASIAELTKVRHVQLPSVARWKRRMEKLLVENFRAASQSCGHQHSRFCLPRTPATYAELRTGAPTILATIPADFAPWKREMSVFWRRYAIEQLRLAALFPKITSEILPLDRSEVLGTGFEDKHFLLTFDDGPSPVHGTSEIVIALLRQRHLHGQFFVLGTSLEARLRHETAADIKNLYAGMCIGSHGKVHKSHVRWKGAVPALASYDRELATYLPAGQPALELFRPPYGERNEKVLRLLKKTHMRSMLWNIDSEDWQHSVEPKTAAGRVLSLMLLWRRGIILFHDVHPKAQVALPIIWKETSGAGIDWVDCHSL